MGWFHPTQIIHPFIPYTQEICKKKIDSHLFLILDLGIVLILNIIYTLQSKTLDVLRIWRLTYRSTDWETTHFLLKYFITMYWVTRTFKFIYNKVNITNYMFILGIPFWHYLCITLWQSGKKCWLKNLEIQITIQEIARLYQSECSQETEITLVIWKEKI